MAAGEQQLQGRPHLAAATGLLQRARLAHPTAGLWEAADLQWWWRKPRRSDTVAQPFVVDDRHDPLAAVVLTDWGDRWACDPLALPDRAADLLPELWTTALDRAAELGIGQLETSVGDDDPLRAQLAGQAGFRPTGSRYAETWLDARDLAETSTLGDGYVLTDRRQDAARPHHLRSRNGPAVAARLAQTSLYRPDLDLCIRARDGEAAAYALFWFDPVTAVGMVEPVRTEDAQQGRGLAGHLLGQGLHRLAHLGATRLKVSHEVDNPAAAALYRSAGFRPGSTSTVHEWDAPPPP